MAMLTARTTGIGRAVVARGVGTTEMVQDSPRTESRNAEAVLRVRENL